MLEKVNPHATRQGTVIGAVERLRFNTAELGSAVQILLERLAPVLGPSNPPPEAGHGAEVRPASCDLEQVIEQQTDGVCAAIRQLRSLADRLEI